MSGKEKIETDLIQTSSGDLVITFIGHGTLILTFENKVFHIDPFSKLTDYTALPKADVILITHEHMDHLDLAAVEKIRKDDTQIILTEICAKQLSGGVVLANGDEHTLHGVKVEAVPAYNIIHKHENGQPFHPKGMGNGYVLTYGDTRAYVAGDTENIPEMKDLKDIQVAFLPMNLPYTMTPEMTADAARSFQPKILYPYHFGNTDTAKLVNLLKAEQGIEVRIRKMA